LTDNEAAREARREANRAARIRYAQEASVPLITTDDMAAGDELASERRHFARMQAWLGSGHA
jgi:hypothetical protein